VFQQFTAGLNQLLTGSGVDIGPVTDDSVLEYFQSDNWAVILTDESNFCGVALLSHGFDIDTEASRLQCAVAGKAFNSSEVAELLARTISAEVIRNPLRGVLRTTQGQPGGITALLNHILSEKLKETQSLKKAA
jgi:hypothetical protein